MTPNSFSRNKTTNNMNAGGNVPLRYMDELPPALQDMNGRYTIDSASVSLGGSALSLTGSNTIRIGCGQIPGGGLAQMSSNNMGGSTSTGASANNTSGNGSSANNSGSNGSSANKTSGNASGGNNTSGNASGGNTTGSGTGANNGGIGGAGAPTTAPTTGGAFDTFSPLVLALGLALVVMGGLVLRFSSDPR